MNEHANKWEYIRFNHEDLTIETEEIVTEIPLTVLLNGEEFATIVCSPTDIPELLIGFLASEGVILFYQEISTLSVDEQHGFAYIEINKTIDALKQNHSKRFIGSCCGKSRQFYFQTDVKTAKTITSKLSISVDQCFELMNQLQNQSQEFKRTGGVHNAAICTANETLKICKDIGRHNALDKIYGHIMKHRISVGDKAVVFSGRISSEVLLKISKIGVGILISKSAPTDLALKLANDLGITVIGFARGHTMNVYTHPFRIAEANKTQ
jgi:FdhD protein